MLSFRYKLDFDQESPPFFYGLTVGAIFFMISRKHCLFSLPLLLTSSLLGFGCVAIAKPLAKSPGFSGTIGVNAAVSDSQSQFTIDDDNEQTDDLNNAGESITTGFAFPFFRLAYTSDDLKTQYFLGQSTENILDSAIQYEIGVTHQFDKRQSMTLAYVPHVPFLKETWSDPFLTNAPRKKSDIDSSAVRIAYKFMPIKVEYAYASYSIEDEQSGSQNTACNGQICTAEEQASLERDSDYQRLSLESSIRLWQGSFLKANVFYADQDAKGDSQSFDEWHYSLSIMTKFDAHFLSLQAAFSDRKYDAENPIFGDVQQDNMARYSLFYSYAKPFNIEDSSLNIIYQNKDIDANIDFYDSTSSFVSVGMSYNF
ncbi:MAG: DUF2860 family protein [Moritella sp.]|uniref:DUF2860 family protein n=1 Tax=Moritella sp. TaxID=78556 RepID=UPI0029B9B22A|nr:DUF2860 family protein [Moritella sp.]MDX2321933.1 DUF2860 family protein [Moritella sp.]